MVKNIEIDKNINLNAMIGISVHEKWFWTKTTIRQSRIFYLFSLYLKPFDSNFFLFLFLYPVYKISIRKSASISTYSTLSSRKLDQDGTLERSFSH